MNTNALKKFAQEARTKLVSQVGAKLEYVLTSDSAELREKAKQVKKLQELINSTSKKQVIDKVAYTWFNRLMALRYMDANDYQPLGIRIVTPKDGYTLPELLDEAKQGNISEELPVKHQHVCDVLDGKIVSSNPQNEAYKELLIGACNHLNKVFPFLFEKIDDYAELLLPDDLTSEFSIVEDMRKGMSIDDCQEVEIVGWLYQFYISELNDELISSKKKYKREDLAPASQLFTPKWIVQYMVDNTLGQLWSEINPNTKVTESLEFHIEPTYNKDVEPRETKSIEDIKFFEPCVGSGHILSYAFDVFYKIYEEQGYNPTDIPELIITKNLYGVDIDQRAAQLASFVLLMKGRQKHRRFFRTIEKQQIQPNISFYQDYEFDKNFKNASALGSLIKITPEEASAFKVDENSLFGIRQAEVKKLYELLGQRYDVVVTNPPYINASRMEVSLKQYVLKEYNSVKSDLFSCFIAQSNDLCIKGGFTSFVTPFVWMFIKSYEDLRKNLIDSKYIVSLIKPSYTSFFESAIVPLATFVLKNSDCTGSSTFYDLGYLGTGKEQPIRLKKAFKNENDINVDGNRTKYIRNQKAFNKVPSSPIGYWLSDKLFGLFEKEIKIGESNRAKQGLATTDNNRFIRFWPETGFNSIGFNCKSFVPSYRFYPFNKAGGDRRWYGHNDYVLDYQDNGEVLINLVKNKYPKISDPEFVIKNRKEYFKESVSWSKLSSSGLFSFRYYPSGFIFNDAANSFFDIDSPMYLLGLLNSKIGKSTIDAINPTLNKNVGDVHSIPLIIEKVEEISALVESVLDISKNEWDSKESSWDFQQNELIRIKGQDIEETYDAYKLYWNNKFFQLHKKEENLNEEFIKVYGLQDELVKEVPLEQITVLREETKVVDNQLVFQEKEVFAQFMSYAVGCMFGRYSIDKEGLLLANQGETLEDYLSMVEKSQDELSFVPDNDNIIPVLNDEWFEDDIVGRFYEFLKVTFGKGNFDKNLAFVEECLGKDVRKFFVKDFYSDHIKRYKKRPIYWMFSSPKGSFNALVYMHRYTPDTLNQILNDYLKEYREKLNTKMEHLDHLIESGSSSEQTKSAKEKDKLKLVLLELQEYEREVLYPLATERIAIDLSDGVLVNYNKFGKAIKEVKGLNDKVTKEKVRKFDWIDSEEII